MLRPFRAVAEEGAKLNVRDAPARWPIRLMDDEGSAVYRLTPQVPGVTARRPVQFSSLGHRALST
jgi:hypothetical protein